jgi:hypothetical protein
MLWRRIALSYMVFSTFLFFLFTSRSLWNDDYQWANGYFFRSAHGSFKGFEGFLPAIIPFVIGLAIVIYGWRGKTGTFALLVIPWSGFQLANLLLEGGALTFRGDTYQVEWTSFLLTGLFLGWPTLAILASGMLVRNAQFGWALAPITNRGWVFLASAVALGAVTGYLEKSGPMVSVANRFAVIFTIAQYTLLMIGVALGGRSASAPVVDRKLETGIGRK